MTLSEIDILVAGPQIASLMEALERTFRVHKLWLADDREDFIRQIVPKIRGLVTSFEYGADAGLIQALPNLEIISNYGVGVEKTDIHAAFRQGVIVTNTPDINEPVADLAFALLLAVTRRVCEADRFLRAGKWAEGRFPFGTHIGGKTCGIVGLGRIGRAVAKRAEAFGMHVAYYGPRSKPDVPYLYYEDLEALARASDFLILSLPGGDATRHLIDARILNALGPEGFLINVARGSVLDEDALYQALASGRIAGAGLDVFETEPLVSSPLISLDNVVLLPHIASATTETRRYMGEVVFDNLKTYFSGGPPLTPLHG